MKRRLSIFAIILVLLLEQLPTVALAADDMALSGFCGAEGNEQNVTWKLELNGETVGSGPGERDAYTLTISGTGAMADYSQKQGYTTAPWNSHREDISRVIVEDGITTIGDCAFWLFSRMTSATIADSVTSIGYRSFYECDILKDFIFPASLRVISDEAFSVCWHLKNLLIPEGVESVGTRAFVGCYQLETIVLPSTVKTLGFGAFGNCSAVTAILIPDSITTMGACAFSKLINGSADGKIFVYETDAASKTTMSLLQTPASGLTDGLEDYNGLYPYSSDYTSLAYVPAGTVLGPGGKPMKENCIIEGYYESNDFSGEKVTELVPGKIYYTKWTDCPHANYDSGTVTVPATCTRSGEITYICQDCGAEKAAEIALLGHDFSGAAASDGSGKHTIACVNPGCTEVSEPLDCDTNGTDGRCSVCEYKKATEPIVPAPNVPASPVMPMIKDTSGGTVTADPPSAAPGSKVTITVKPDPGYQLEDLVVTDKDGNRIECTDNGDGTYSYRQPNGRVTIEARFVKVSCDGGAACPCRKFIDLDPSLWYHHEIDCVLELGLMNGVGANTFDPNGHMSRCMLMTVLARLDGQDTSTGETWYSAGLAWATERGISDGSAPEEAVTRQELVTMLWRYAGCPQAGTPARAPFADGGETASWAVQSMAWAVETGLVAGTDGGLLLPAATATRAQVAAILARFLA